MAYPTRPCSAVHPRQQRGLRTLSAMALTVTSLLAARPVAGSQQVLAAVRQQGHPAGAAAATYGQLPLSFQPNVGQADPRVRFLAHGQGYTLFLIETGAVLSLHAVQQPVGPDPLRHRPAAALPRTANLVRMTTQSVERGSPGGRGAWSQRASRTALQAGVHHAALWQLPGGLGR